MAARAVTVCGGVKARVFRISFSGELAYELAVPARYGEALMRTLMRNGAPFGAIPYGTEALGVMRIEKGHPAGNELNGQTTAADIGLGKMMSKKKDFIGRVMAQRPALVAADRPCLAGFRPLDRGKTPARGRAFPAARRRRERGERSGLYDVGCSFADAWSLGGARSSVQCRDANRRTRARLRSGAQRGGRGGEFAARSLSIQTENACVPETLDPVAAAVLPSGRYGRDDGAAGVRLRIAVRPGAGAGDGTRPRRRRHRERRARKIRHRSAEKAGRGPRPAAFISVGRTSHLDRNGG